MRVRFGECSLDSAARRLVRAGRAVHLSPKAFDLLLFLVTERPRAVPKRELVDRIWPDVFVSENSLTRAVNEIRDALGARSRDSSVVRTVHGHGNAFNATVVEEPEDGESSAGAPACWRTGGDLEFALSEEQHIIGRDLDATIRLESSKVSRRYAVLDVRGGRATMTDLGSKNGTCVRGVRIDASTPLNSGDTLAIGPYMLTFTTAGLSQTTETQTVSRASARRPPAT